jgi:hypothetical protein
MGLTMRLIGKYSFFVKDAISIIARNAVLRVAGVRLNRRIQRQRGGRRTSLPWGEPPAGFRRKKAISPRTEASFRRKKVSNRHTQAPLRRRSVLNLLRLRRLHLKTAVWGLPSRPVSRSTELAEVRNRHAPPSNMPPSDFGELSRVAMAAYRIPLVIPPPNLNNGGVGLKGTILGGSAGEKACL